MYVAFLQGCPSFSHLTLTGGAIGSGPPLAVGAAIACPHRCVINLQVCSNHALHLANVLPMPVICKHWLKGMNVSCV